MEGMVGESPLPLPQPSKTAHSRKGPIGFRDTMSVLKAKWIHIYKGMAMHNDLPVLHMGSLTRLFHHHCMSPTATARLATHNENNQNVYGAMLPLTMTELCGYAIQLCWTVLSLRADTI